MLALLSMAAMAAPGTAELACVAELPPLPDKAERRDLDAVQAMADAGQRPEWLVPWAFEESGVERYTRTWRDEAGGRWAWSQVRALWAAEPYARPHVQSLQTSATLSQQSRQAAKQHHKATTAIHVDYSTGMVYGPGLSLTREEHREARDLLENRLAGADALESAELRDVAKAMCAFNMAPQLHAEEAAERAAQARMIEQAAAAGGPDAATWNLARMLQDNRGAAEPTLADAEAVQRCVEAGTGTGELLSAADAAKAEGSLGAALRQAGLGCAKK